MACNSWLICNLAPTGDALQDGRLDVGNACRRPRWQDGAWLHHPTAASLLLALNLQLLGGIPNLKLHCCTCRLEPGQMQTLQYV
jgi:hypothetical protein